MTQHATYVTARAFRQALEMRLNREATGSGEDVQRLRRQVAFDRLLARVFSGEGTAWTLKGGYAMPNRPAPNSRVKDLVDLALLVQRLPLDPALLRKALDQTFSRRGSHPLPAVLQEPATAWDTPFAALAAETKLGLTMAEAFAAVQSFYRGVGNP